MRIAAGERVAGIMGGEHSGCTEETTTVFLESAWWDPIRTAYTGRDLKIHSDARYRFERGVDPDYTLPGLEAATQMILDLCGGEPSEVVQAGAPRSTRRGATSLIPNGSRALWAWRSRMPIRWAI